jgi:hypothetical protein
MRDAQRRKAQADADLLAAMLDGLEQGMSVRTVALVTGMSVSAVQRRVADRRSRKG